MIDLAPPLAATLAQSGGVEGAIAGAAGIPVAFAVGMVSFFSPCILPLVPGYLSYMSGVSGEDLEEGGRRGRVVAASALFVLGFAVIFTLLGAATSALGEFLLERLSLLNRIAGAFVIVMGLAFLSSLYIRALTRQAEAGGLRGSLSRGALRAASVFARERALGARPRAGLVGAFPLGAAFAVGWVPCVGPGLATILTIAVSEGSVLRGAILLFSFSLGFGVWFLLGALAFRRTLSAFAVVRRHIRVITAAGGLLLLAIGILLVTDLWGDVMAPLRRWAARFTPPI